MTIGAWVPKSARLMEAVSLRLFSNESTDCALTVQVTKRRPKNKSLPMCMQQGVKLMANSALQGGNGYKDCLIFRILHKKKSPELRRLLLHFQ
ncbi:MAG: hypothetical protein EAZ17_09315 [Sphingobacteriales bacterium]|nr:MAG: hypothetical protein EAZ17_09315 [Sphingobacteriales bacterium]